MKLNKIKYSSCLVVFGGCADRFVSSYKPGITLEDRFMAAGSVPDIKGVDFYQNWDIGKDTVDEVKGYLKKYNLDPTTIVTDVSSLIECARGGFTNPDRKARDKAIEHCKEAMDLAEKINCKTINFWFGQDGYDYSFQIDHEKALKNFISITKDMADYNQDINIGLEYKPREPRNYCFRVYVFSTLYWHNSNSQINKKN